MGFWNKGPEQGTQEASAANAEQEAELRQSMLAGVMDKSQAAWKADRIAKNPGETTRFKGTKDAAWVKANEGTPLLKKNEDGSYEADLLAIDSARDLPIEFRADTERSTMMAVGAVLNAVRENRALDDTFIDEVSALIHVRWLDVHRDDPWTTPEQKLPYDQLSEEEKDRDRLFVRFAIGEYEARKK